MCGLVLAAVFVRAATAKVARLSSAENGFAALGLPAPAALARVVPSGELTVAVLLIAAPRAGGLAAAAVLAVFTAVLVRAVVAGTRAGCPCFGTARMHPVSGLDVVRNCLLSALAVVALWAPEPVLPEPAQAVGAIALCLMGAGALAVLRRRLPAPRQI